MPKLLATFLVTMLALALGAGPALAHGHGHGHGRAHYRHAKQASDYAYVATINCGRGDVTVYSDEDLYAPLVDLDHHRTYFPIAWDVEVDGQTVLQDEKPKVPKGLKKLARKCSYTDGVATGTVTVLGPLPGVPN